MEQTLTLVKPDGVTKRLIGSVIQRFEQAGLQLVGLKMLRLSRPDAERFYAEHNGRPFYRPLIDFMVSSPIVAMVWEADDAIQKARALMGATNSPEAAAGTLRKQFGTDNRENLVHGSDSAASAAREVAFFFKPEDVFHYQARPQSEKLKI